MTLDFIVVVFFLYVALKKENKGVSWALASLPY